MLITDDVRAWKASKRHHLETFIPLQTSASVRFFPLMHYGKGISPEMKKAGLIKCILKR